MDNVAINIDGVLYLRVMDPYKVKADKISGVNFSINTLCYRQVMGLKTLSSPSPSWLKLP